MCGIAGIRTVAPRSGPGFDELQRMAAVLQHRGPDGHGFYLDAETGLAHTRLSLLDLQGGAQPLANEDQSVWLVANGEIFEHARLREELERRGHTFRTHTDVEVILHAYEEWQEAAWSRLDGQFAFALWDTRSRTLHLVRDRLGILPLHYAVLPDCVVFGSEAKALFASGRLRAEFDAACVREAFTFWAALPPHTVFAGVHSVAPGSCISFGADLRTRHQVWWQLDFAASGPAPASLGEAGERLDAHLRAAVRRRLVADVPVGCYLSGGLDSSLLTAIAARECRDLQTFSLRFEDPAFDETAAQHRVRRLFGVAHQEVMCTGQHIRDLLPDVVWHCETPLLRTAPAPMFLLSGLVRRHGIKAVLTGEGADELLGGYSIFLEDKVRRFWARQPESELRPALLARVHDFVGTPAQRSHAMWRAFHGSGLNDTGDAFYSHAVRWRNTAWTTRVLRPLPGGEPSQAAREQQLLALLPPGYRGWPPLARAQAIEIATFLGSYLLSSQGDRVALGHGVEARYTFLDPEVVSFCSGLADRFKVRGLRTKVVLREVARKYLPPDVCERGKQPYRAPVASALLAAGPSDYVDELLCERRLRENPLVEPTVAQALVAKARRAGAHVSERESMALCGLVTLQLAEDAFCRRLSARTDALSKQLEHRPPDVMAGDRCRVRSTPTPP